MALAIWLRALSATIWPRRNRGNGLFLDEKSLRFELARERMRVDRNQSPLAVLTIELPASRSTPSDFDFLARVLIRRPGNQTLLPRTDLLLATTRRLGRTPFSNLQAAHDAARRR